MFSTMNYLVKSIFVLIFSFWSLFVQYDLYAQICGLSYMGDLRMLFAEDKDKVMKMPVNLWYNPPSYIFLRISPQLSESSLER
jgi:hypothetical protein